jgi:hypothetical protein
LVTHYDGRRTCRPMSPGPSKPRPAPAERAARRIRRLGAAVPRGFMATSVILASLALSGRRAQVFARVASGRVAPSVPHRPRQHSCHGCTCARGPSGPPASRAVLLFPAG